ncbi:MAG: HAD family hydrolase [Dehalococcoidia bacterium]
MPVFGGHAVTPPLAVSVVVFDIDGTLVDFGAAFQAGLRATALDLSRLVGREVPVRDLWAAQQAAGSVLDGRPGGRGQYRMAALRSALASFSCDEGQVAALIDVFTAARDGLVQPYTDAESTVVALRARGFELIAASNGNSDLTRLPLFDHFKTRWLAAEVGLSKPDPRFFLGALERVGVRPEAAVMVGDRLDNDYEPARSVGMHAVLVDRERKVEDPSVLRVSALAELLELVERAG